MRKAILALAASVVWAVGAWWDGSVALAWTKAVRASLHEIAVEAERRAAA